MCSKDETLQNNLIWYRLEWTVVFCEMVLKMYFFNWTLILSWYVISMHFYVNKVLMTTELCLMCACDLWVIEWGVPAWYRAIGGQFCQFVDLLLQKYVSWTNTVSWILGDDDLDARVAQNTHWSFHQWTCMIPVYFLSSYWVTSFLWQDTVSP